MFTIADIRDIAIQIEINGEKTYRQASRDAKDPQIAELFNWMADEERRHAQWFESIAVDKPLTEEQIELEKMGRALLKEMIAGQTFSMDEEELKTVTSFKEMVSQSKSFEKDTILFYEFLKGVLDDKQVEIEIDKIIAEEQAHYEKLKELEGLDDPLCVSA